MSSLDKYSADMYYPPDARFTEADPATVLAIYSAYHFEKIDFSKYQSLAYLRYSVAHPLWVDLSALSKLELFACTQPTSSPHKPICTLLSNCTDLFSLSLDKVNLLAEDQLVGIEKFSKLNSLFLANLNLKGFPKGIISNTQLAELDIYSCDICSTPSEISHLNRLTSLTLTDCKLTQFPQIQTLANLNNLNMSNNPLGTIPDWIGSLTNLKRLDISNCGLTTLPESLCDLPHLEKITATGNPIVHLPAGLKKLKSKLNIELKFKALYDEAIKKRLETLGSRPAVFTDFGFKLMVIQTVMYDNAWLQPRFNVYEFAKSYSARVIDLESPQAYGVIPEVRAYFEDLEIPLYLLEDIEELYSDGGDEIYAQISPRWSGEDDFYTVQSAKDVHFLPKLKKINSPFLSKKALQQLKKKGIDAEA